MVKVIPDSRGLITIGSRDTDDGIYGFTSLTGRNLTGAYSAYIDEVHATIATAPGDLVIQDDSFLGTHAIYAIGLSDSD